jgi:hypothetical protein
MTRSVIASLVNYKLKAVEISYINTVLEFAFYKAAIAALKMWVFKLGNISSKADKLNIK